MTISTPLDVKDDALLRLEVAARVAFPDGSIKLSSLRREAARGNLTVWRIANKDMTSLAEIRSMVDKCRLAPSLPASGSDQHEAPGRRPGSSSTPDVSTAQAAALMRVERLKKSCASTSRPSTTSRPGANVVSIKRP